MALVVVTEIRLTLHTHIRFMCLTLHVKLIPTCPRAAVLYSRGGLLCDSFAARFWNPSAGGSVQKNLSVNCAVCVLSLNAPVSSLC